MTYVNKTNTMSKVDTEALLKSEINVQLNRDRPDGFSKGKTLATILLASLIGFTGIWFTWKRGGCLQIGQVAQLVSEVSSNYQFV